jgi:hypothetical protein
MRLRKNIPGSLLVSLDQTRRDQCMAVCHLILAWNRATPISLPYPSSMVVSSNQTNSSQMTGLAGNSESLLAFLEGKTSGPFSSFLRQEQLSAELGTGTPRARLPQPQGLRPGLGVDREHFRPALSYCDRACPSISRSSSISIHQFACHRHPRHLLFPQALRVGNRSVAPGRQHRSHRHPRTG